MTDNLKEWNFQCVNYICTQISLISNLDCFDACVFIYYFIILFNLLIQISFQSYFYVDLLVSAFLHNIHLIFLKF